MKSDIEHARFDPRYRQRLDLHQPTDEALQWLADRDDVHLSLAEFSLDWTFNDETDRNDALVFLYRHLVKKHHRDQRLRIVGTPMDSSSRIGQTIYFGPRRAPNVLLAYADRASKVTGEVYCVHLEWRSWGSALRRMGIGVKELVAFNHRMFWLNRLCLYGLIVDRLGRAYFQRQEADEDIDSIRRDPWILQRGKFTYNVDRRMGSMIIRACGSSVQEVVDHMRKRLDIRSSMVAMNDSHLLPDDPMDGLPAGGRPPLIRFKNSGKPRVGRR